LGGAGRQRGNSATIGILAKEPFWTHCIPAQQLGAELQTGRAIFEWIAMDVNEYNQLIGAIVTNLQALESVLRYFLMRRKAKEVEFPRIGAAEAIENALTNYTFLGVLIDQFNNSLSLDEQHFKVDRQVVEIKDAIAHGRLLATEQQPPFRLWKFGRPKNGRSSGVLPGTKSTMANRHEEYDRLTETKGRRLLYCSRR
jgi:hypothetical protein